jgi:hypothetical protein
MNLTGYGRPQRIGGFARVIYSGHRHPPQAVAEASGEGGGGQRDRVQEFRDSSFAWNEAVRSSAGIFSPILEATPLGPDALHQPSMALRPERACTLKGPALGFNSTAASPAWEQPCSATPLRYSVPNLSLKPRIPWARIYCEHSSINFL